MISRGQPLRVTVAEAELQRKAAISDACTRAAETLYRRRRRRVGRLLPAMVVAREGGAAKENLLACNVGLRASKTRPPLPSLPPFFAQTQSLPTYLISFADSHAIPPLPALRGLEALIVASDGNAAVGLAWLVTSIPERGREREGGREEEGEREIQARFDTLHRSICRDRSFSSQEYWLYTSSPSQYLQRQQCQPS